ncbi:5'/3'-nucleotidase SurE [Clostridium sp. WILCCON 0269]|uniref:5'-nucleotidase SurE n=1 Tax=Candidatus Clostridium eludens TaxID=3381663 RepID=A0ABW8SQ97_9CLOT
MRLLLTNDDGIMAEGLHVLAKHFEKDNEVIIAAPDMQRSGSGHSITTSPNTLVAREVKLEGINSKAYSINGTPADCARLGIRKLGNNQIDMVISGINNGFNLGIDSLYSGTVSAAIEASICEVPSIAVSLDTKGNNYDYNIAAEYALEVFSIFKDKYKGDNVVLSLNVPLLPREKIKGLKVCRVGFKYHLEETYDNSENVENLSYNYTDIYYVKRGYVTLTPLHYDLTNYKILKDINNLFTR